MNCNIQVSSPAHWFSSTVSTHTNLPAEYLASICNGQLLCFQVEEQCVQVFVRNFAENLNTHFAIHQSTTDGHQHFPELSSGLLI
jgi:hypothetical protein